jgi:hypothetical protein
MRDTGAGHPEFLIQRVEFDFVVTDPLSTRRVGGGSGRGWCGGVHVVYVLCVWM